MSAVFFYLLTVIFTSWVFSLASSINANLTWKEKDRIAQRKHYEQQIKILKRRQHRDPDDPLPEFKAKEVETESEGVVRQFEAEGLEG